jgi:hypothetical protein
LRWGQAGEAPDGDPLPLRYCHHCGADEAERLTAKLGIERLATFASDGRPGDLNLYHLLRRS